jgi:hypothetical protein
VLEDLLGDKIKTAAKESPGYYKLQNNKLWFQKGCLQLLDKMKQAKLQWLQDPGEKIEISEQYKI